MPLPALVINVILPSMAVVLAAWVVQNNRDKLFRFFPPRASDQPATFVIGDLHGDVECARYWVVRTGLIRANGDWSDPDSHLVFMGDYVDKGPTSRHVVEYVKALTEQYPKHVTALLGNHEMELLLDRDKTRWHSNSWGAGVGYFGLAYSSVYPGEYLNYLVAPPTKEDERIVEALYNASAEVYGKRLHQSMFLGTADQVGSEKSVLQFIQDADLRARATARLKNYQTAYIDAYGSGTALGAWLETRPIVAQIHDTIFVHGGISDYGSMLLKNVGVEHANQLFADNANQGSLNTFITTTQIGQIMYDMLTFRGNHQPNACSALSKLLPKGASRLGVGHTPGKSVRLLCNGTVLALDSSLGRWFRNSGNLYCHGKHPVQASNGHYVCNQMNSKCQGQIVKLPNNGGVEILERKD